MKMKKILSVLLAVATLFTLAVIPAFASGEAQVPEMIDGASIRCEGETMQGLRFIGRIKKTGSVSLTLGNSANFGILLIPQSALNANVTIDKDTPNVLKVPAKILMAQASVEAMGLTYDNDYYYFSAVQLGIPVDFYATEWVARAYVNNGGTYTYSNQVKRSVKAVAEAILKDDGSAFQTVATNVINAYNESDGAVVVDYSNLASLVKYPDYPDNIQKDTLYNVTVAQGQKFLSLPVYNQAADYSHLDKNSNNTRALGAMDGDRRFCEFAFAYAAVTVHIAVNRSFSTYTVSPSSKAFETSYADGVISVKLDQPEYFVLILDNDYNTALAVFADAPETNVPAKGAKG